VDDNDEWKENNNLQTGVRESGSFFSKTTDEVGEWFFDDGLITLKWGVSMRQFEFHQKSHSSEINWKCDIYPYELNITNLGPNKYLPGWIIPIAPEDTRTYYERRRLEREVRFQVDEGKARGDMASRHTECPICFFELHLFPVAILRFQSKRSCPHYFHATCASMYKTRVENMILMDTKNHGDNENKHHIQTRRVACPVCMSRFTEVKTLPDLLADPRLWFQLCDTDLTGTLDKKEVIAGLLAVLPVERPRLEKALDEYWSSWDQSGDGFIAFQEFIDPETGLKSFVLNNYNIFKRDREASSKALRDIPPLDSKPRQWFDYWDQNHSGTLERIEIIRAMIKTFCVTAWGDPLIRRAPDIAQLSQALWDALGYKPREKISFQEFMKPFGLADQVIHNHVHGQFFGDSDGTGETADTSD
jgi:hypothetical protein